MWSKSHNENLSIMFFQVFKKNKSKQKILSGQCHSPLNGAVLL